MSSVLWTGSHVAGQKSDEQRRSTPEDMLDELLSYDSWHFVGDEQMEAHQLKGQCVHADWMHYIYDNTLWSPHISDMSRFYAA